jgi:predicted dehydrogenase
MSGPRIAVVGAGHMGSLHAAKLAQLEREGVLQLAGVCDVDRARAEALAQRCQTGVLADLAEVERAADAACIAVPTSLHFAVSARLLDAGLDALVEKPLAASRPDARALIERAREAGRVLQVGHIERFSRVFREIQPLLNRPRFIEAHRIGPYPARAADVGVVLDLMIHDLDLAVQLAGAEVERVEAIGVPVLSTTEDIANARVRFTNGCILNLTASRVSLERMRKLRLFQRDAYISIDFGANKATIVQLERAPGASEPKISARTLELDDADALLAQDRSFARAVRERSVPEVPGEDGYRALDLALRIQESIPPLEDLT